MTAIKLDGKQLALKIQQEMIEEVSVFKTQYHKAPKLVVVLVGENPASCVYVNHKMTYAQKVGFQSEVIKLPETVSQEELLNEIERLNNDNDVNGILVQLPLPKHIDEQTVLVSIAAQKDVDGFHPTNVGNFVLGNDSTIPCTPYGIMELLKEYQIDVAGKLAVVVGRSNIVGKPMATLLQRENATVIMAHSKTQELKALTKQADIVVVAIGRGNFIDDSYINDGAIVIDVGMNRDENGKLIGDVHPNVMDKASYMTPVPGGVGPMTVTMLIKQTMEQAKKQV